MKILKILKSKPVEELDTDYDDIYYNSTKSTDTVADNASSTGSVGDLYNEFDNDDAGVRIVISEESAKVVAEKEPLRKKIFTPKSCQDGPGIVDGLKDGRVIVIYVEELDRENFLRLFDYVMGAVQALDATLDRIDRDTVVLLPYGIDKDIALDEIEEEVDSENSDNKG